MGPHPVVCFHCGLPVGDPPRLNMIDDEEPCTACAERLLETLPGIFHVPYEAVEAREEQDEQEAALEGGSGQASGGGPGPGPAHELDEGYEGYEGYEA